MKRRTRNQLYQFPLPRNDEEFALLTLWYFGARLSLSRFSFYGSGASYEVAEKYNDYHGKGFAYGECCIKGYDSSAEFLRQVFGGLNCGGIASSSYGQTTVIGHRNKQRLKAWEISRRGKGGSAARPVFVRLAADIGGGERARIRGVRSLSLGRVDGAEAVRIASGASQS